MSAVPVTLRLRLADARQRGEPFASAWPVALAAALRGQPKWERDAWAPVFTSTLDAWRGAYQREGEDTAFSLVFADRESGAGGRICANSTCCKTLPPDTHGNVLYCSAECRRAVNREREVAGHAEAA